MGRSHRNRACLCGVIVLAMAGAARADVFPAEFAEREGTQNLRPIAPWNIDFGENRCTLSRMFEGKRGTHVIFFKQAAPGERFGMTMAGDGLRKFRRGTWTYLAMRRDVPFKHLTGERYGEVPDIGRAIIIPDIFIGGEDPRQPSEGLASAGIDLAGAAKIDRVVLKLGSSGLSFETGNLAGPIQALNVCTSDLLRAWRLDPEKHKSYRPARFTNREPIAEAIRSDYPRSALYRNEQGVFRARLIVEKDGTVSNCHVEKSTETEFLETPACTHLRKARFEPAPDSKGKPMRSFFATTITYAIN